MAAGPPAASVVPTDAFSSLDLPEFSHFPIEDGNFGDLEFLDLASDRLLEKNKSKFPGQFSDIYFNSIATPSGYCSANYLTEEANRLTLLLSESSDRLGFFLFCLLVGWLVRNNVGCMNMVPTYQPYLLIHTYSISDPEFS